MKYFFLSLLLLNVLYALWQFQGRQLAPQLPAAQSAAAVEERMDGQVREAELGSGSIALCINLGEFERSEQAEQLRQRLLALDIQSRVVARDVLTDADYWLVSPAGEGRRAALNQLLALQDQGIDGFLITEGEFAGHLSLGVFSREDHALARQEQLLALGQEAVLHAVMKSDQAYFVEVASAARRLIDPALLSRLRRDFPSLQHQYQSCAGVANRIRIP